MKNAVTRASAWVSLVLMTCAPLAESQTVEWYSGGRLVNDIPATDTSVTPLSIATAPDGTLYMADLYRTWMLRRDPSTGKMFTMPPGSVLPLDYEKWGYVQRIFAAPNGFIYYVSLAVLYRYNPTTGDVVRLTDFYSNPNLACRNSVPIEFAMDSNGALFWTDRGYNAVCKMVSTLPFPIMSSDPGFSGDGGPASSAQLNHPYGIAIDPANNIYVADQGNNRVRKIATGTNIITTIAGNGGASGGENVVATATGIDTPYALAVDAAGSLYISEYGKYRVRRLDLATGRISTYAGTGTFSSTVPANGVPATSVPIGKADMLAIDANGDLVIADTWQRIVRRVTRSTGLINSIAGNGDLQYCGENVLPRDACLFQPTGLAVDTNGDIYIADSGNRRIRRVSAATGLLSTFAGKYGPDVFSGNGGPATSVVFGANVNAVTFDRSGNLFVAAGTRVHRISRAGILTTIGGTGDYGFSGDGGPALAAKIGNASYIAVDDVGNVFITDQSNNRIRRIAAGSGIITTVAGTGVTDGPLGDGGPATSASLSFPMKIAFDPAGNLLVVDNSHSRIRRIDKLTGLISTIAGNGTSGTSGDGGPATLASISNWSFAIDPTGNILLFGSQVRRIDAATGIITTVATLPIKTPEGFSIGGTSDLAYASNGDVYAANNPAVLKATGLPYTPADSSPPDIQSTVSGALGANGWYVGDVQVSWSVTDPESAIRSTSGCDAVLVNQDTTGMSITCNATSTGGSNSSTVTIKRDTTPPTLDFGAGIPVANANGWNGTDVTVPYSTSDATSGIASTSLPSPLSFASEGIGMSQSVTVIDNAGNTATFTSPAVSIDKTPPVVSADVSGTPGSNGWYVGDVQVGWSINEIPTSIESSSGCGAGSVTLDTSGSTFTCTVTSAGGTTTRSTTIKRDATPPTLVFDTPAPAPNPAGWYNNDTSIPFTVNDATSGVAATSQPSPVTLTNEGVGLSRTVTVTDVAGNSASYSSAPINIDKTGPVVAPIVTGTLGNDDWYVSDVTVSWSILEMPESITFVNGCETNTVTSDTDGVMFGCVVDSQAGGMGVPQWIKRDTTPATVQWGAFSPVANANGWNKTNVTVPYTVSDALSGVSGATSGKAVISAEGAGVTAKVTVTDKAGNVATIDSPPRNIDKTPPLVTVSSPANGATYGFYQDVFADFACTDLSLLSCIGTTAEGAAVNTKVAGTRTYKVTAKDSVAFTTSVTNTFDVASSFNFDGFLGNAQPSPALNLVPKGSLVPIRWRLPDGNGGFVTNTASFSSAAVSTVTCSGAATPLNETGSGATGIGFDPATNVFTYNWKTGATWSGCRQLLITLKDGSQRGLLFKFQ